MAGKGPGLGRRTVAAAGLLAAVAWSAPVLGATPTPSAPLTLEQAAELAAALANDECERLYERRPFAPSQYAVERAGDRFSWGRLDPGGKGGFSALVSFDQTGRDREATCYWSTDALDSGGALDLID